MAALILLVLALMGILLAGSLIIFQLLVESGQKERNKRPVDNRINKQGGHVMPDEEKKVDSYSGLKDAVDQLIAEVGLPETDIETARQYFAGMSKRLRGELQTTLGPVAAQNAGDMVSLELKKIVKAEEDRGRVAIWTNQRALRVILTKVWTQLDARTLDERLNGVQMIASVIAKYDQDKAPEVYQALMNAAIRQTSEEFLEVLTQGQDSPTASQAIERIDRLLLPNPDRDSRVTGERAAVDFEELFDSEIIEPGFSGNGAG